MLTTTTSSARRAPQPFPPADNTGAHVEGQGSAIVLLHSAMSSRKQWREFIQGMRGTHRLIAIDLLGYGDVPSPKWPGWYSLDDEVRRVESVLAAELDTDERFHLVGHSYGGVVGLQLAQATPQRLRSLTLFEPILFHLLPDHDPVVAELLAVRRQVEAGLRSGDFFRGTAAFVDYWSGRGAFSRMSPERQAALSKLLPKTLLEIRAVAGATPRGDNYRRIDVPTCLMTGRLSPRAAHLASEILAGLLPRARAVQVEAGHMAPATHPALVNPIIERFIHAASSGKSA
jgi:pimeloyl-ACP methyl ester carboxylesterase